MCLREIWFSLLQCLNTRLLYFTLKFFHRINVQIIQHLSEKKLFWSLIELIKRNIISSSHTVIRIYTFYSLVSNPYCIALFIIKFSNVIVKSQYTNEIFLFSIFLTFIILKFLYFFFILKIPYCSKVYLLNFLYTSIFQLALFLFDILHSSSYPFCKILEKHFFYSFLSVEKKLDLCIVRKYFKVAYVKKYGLLINLFD